MKGPGETSLSLEVTLDRRSRKRAAMLLRRKEGRRRGSGGEVGVRFESNELDDRLATVQYKGEEERAGESARRGRRRGG
jgi:tryptophan 2,3-dioxygenase